jgi:hypothetical protein
MPPPLMFVLDETVVRSLDVKCARFKFTVRTFFVPLSLPLKLFSFFLLVILSLLFLSFSSPSSHFPP